MICRSLVRGTASLAIAASLFVIAQPTSADQITEHISQEQRQLNQAKSEIASLKAQIAAAQNQEAALAAIIAHLDAQIAATQAQVASATVHLDAINVRLSNAQSDLDAARQLLGTEQRELSRELVIYYEFENQSTPLSNLLSSGSFNQFWTDVINGGRISQRELQTVNLVSAQRDAVAGDVARMSSVQREQRQLLGQLYVTEQSLDDDRSARTEAIAYLARIQAADERSAREWEAAENTINNQIAQLQKEEAAARAAGGGGGHFIWPDTGPISQGFGCTPYPFEPYDPACPQKHFHNGLDIAGACGNDIVAADAGIAYIEPFERYGFGNYIIIVNGNGWQTLYGHLARFAIHSGQKVARGQLIGYEGTSGNSTGCHLHFGVNHNGAWVNPRAYLPKGLASRGARVAYTGASSRVGTYLVDILGAVAERFDIAILGGGMGGYPAAIRAAQLGLRAVLVEEDKVGGTCLHRGCIPAKALLQSAALLDELQHAEAFGVTTGDVRFDYAVAGRRRDQVVSQLHKGVQFLLRKNKVSVVNGRGRLAGAGRLAVTGVDGEVTEVEADAVILATGSRPKQLPGVEADGVSILTSDEALRLNRVPASAIVLGAGAVGVEFASLYRSCGAEVTLVEMLPSLVPLEDADIGTELRRQFEARGIVCLTGHRLDLTSVERTEGGVAVTVAAEDGTEQRLNAELLLVAVGRAANVEDIGIEGTGVAVERGVIAVDSMLRTGQAGVSAVGDVVGGFQLAHKALHEGVLAVEAIAGRDPHPLDPRLVTRTTYCSPQIGSLGLSEAEARAAGHEVAVGVMPFRGNGRAVIWGDAAGFCKVVADKTAGDVLGVHIIGHEVTELIWGPALGGLLESTAFEMGHAVAPHPTLSEVLSEAALAVNGEAIHI